MVAAFIRENFPGLAAEAALEMAGIGDKGIEYSRSKSGNTLWWLWQILRAVTAGNSRAKRKLLWTEDYGCGPINVIESEWFFPQSTQHWFQIRRQRSRNLHAIIIKIQECGSKCDKMKPFPKISLGYLNLDPCLTWWLEGRLAILARLSARWRKKEIWSSLPSWSLAREIFCKTPLLFLPRTTTIPAPHTGFLQPSLQLETINTTSHTQRRIVEQ